MLRAWLHGSGWWQLASRDISLCAGLPGGDVLEFVEFHGLEKALRFELLTCSTRWMGCIRLQPLEEMVSFLRMVAEETDTSLPISERNPCPAEISGGS